ncbi:MAG: cysteine synthase family protein [Phaeodactylibacter sp.]|nr:cysteine synthase family protein [Phaeodactylibacter sp.]MCB9276097.1 cysteine synthase family protein [Lewinellaceae bacterium]
MRYENVLATIGNTPLIELSRICHDIPAKVYGKVEAYNPGNSAKDRIALYMVEQAEKDGLIKPGDTIIEATSGNTGYSLAMVCSLKGYHCVLTVSSKASQEKLALLRSMGAEVIVCPANVEPEDPRSYYSRAEQLAKDIPNSFYLGQNFNLDNSAAHYHTTGPEIWRDTEGQVTHYVCCAGTGGTLSGTAQYLKDQNPDVRIVAVDAYGSVLKKYWETGLFDKDEIYPYKVEGLGKNIIPGNIDFDVIDEFIKVTDRSSAHRARQLALVEGLLLGYSSGAAIQAVFRMKNELKPTDMVVVLFPDHGSRYLGKIYNDEWMKQQGFMPNTAAPEDSYARYRKIYRAYRMKYKRYLRQTLRNLS